MRPKKKMFCLCIINNENRIRMVVEKEYKCTNLIVIFLYIYV